MKLAVVSSYPPSTTTLNEYGYYITNQFEQKSEVSELFLFHDKIEEELIIPQEHDRIKPVACWKFNRLDNFIRITRAALKHKPDVIFINMQFLQFGSNKVAAALGLMTPMILRLLGFKVVVLLHNIIETVDYCEAGITRNKVLKWIFNGFGFILTKLILQADMVCLTMRDYAEILNKKYKADNVAMIPHGAFETPPMPDFEKESRTPLQVMTFGKFGTYKKVEPLIEAIAKVRSQTDRVIELVIAGTDNPNVKGYLAAVQKKYAHIPNIRFTGYVPEEDVPKIFGDSTVVVFPYTSTTGSSGVLHQASSYGKAAILPNIGDLATLVEEEGYTGAFFQPDDVDSLADAIYELLTDDTRRIKIAQQNYFAAISVSMSDISSWYMLHFRMLMQAKSVDNTYSSREVARSKAPASKLPVPRLPRPMWDGTH